jgi:hypothetical protein
MVGHARKFQSATDEPIATSIGSRRSSWGWPDEFLSQVSIPRDPIGRSLGEYRLTAAYGQLSARGRPGTPNTLLPSSLFGAASASESRETGFTHAAALHGELSNGTAVVTPEPYLIAPLRETREQSRVHHVSRDVTRPDGNMGAVPGRVATANLDFATAERRRGPDDGGPDVTADVDDD